MGWGDCGHDSAGRPIGYSAPAICDHPGCEEVINRGLSCKCGPMHGDNAGLTCEGYFCEKHRVVVETRPGTFARSELGEIVSVCPACAERLEAEDELADEEAA